MEKNTSHSSSTSRTIQQQPPSNSSTSSITPSRSNSIAAAAAANIQNSYSHGYPSTSNYPQQQQRSNQSYPQQQQSNRSYPQQQQRDRLYQEQQSNRSYPQQSNRSYPQQRDRLYQEQQSFQSYQQQQSNRSYPQQRNRSYPQQQQRDRSYPQQSNRSYPQQQQRDRLYQEQQQQSNRSYPQREGSYQEEKMARESRSKRFGNARDSQAEISYSRPKAVGAGVSTRRNNYQDGNKTVVRDIVKGTSQEVEKCYLRLTSAPDPATVRPEEVLEKALLMVQKSQKNYLYKCDQLKSIRQDLMVQHIRNELTVKVYETHARLAIEVGDLSEYNQCQSQLQELYAEGNRGCDMEFSAYNLLYVILHSNNNRDLLSAMSRLSVNARKDEAVKHALAVRAAVTSGNYVLFFRLYKEAPYLSTCLMDLYVEKMRYTAVKCICRSYRPTLPVAYIAQLLGFSSVLLPTEPSDEKDVDGLEECAEWLKAHGACLMDNTGEVLLDTKASSSSLFMPKPEVDVVHGDATLSVNDFLIRASS